VTALDDLAARLVVAPWRPAPGPSTLPGLISELQQRLQAGSSATVAAGPQQQALRRFWADPTSLGLKELRWVAFGLALPLAPSAPRLIEHPARFQALLAQVERWRSQPRHFRRLYQGLLHGYFGFDARAPDVAPAARSHWERLRSYLAERAPQLVAPQHNPEWVRTVLLSRHLFGEQPGQPYAAALLTGDGSAVALLKAQLGIPAGSWFVRELVLAQLHAAVALDDPAFVARIAPVLSLLAGHPLLHDTGLRLLLDRCAALPADAPPHDGLLQLTLRTWGEPAAADPRWGSVTEAASTMFAAWMRWTAIASFFRSHGGEMATRRARFWQRYVPAITALREPVPGRLVMRLGSIVTAVEAGALPEPLQLHEPAASTPPLRLPHRDGEQGWSTWEGLFEATLRQRYELRPGVAAPLQPARHLDLSEHLPPAHAAVEITTLGAPHEPTDEPGADAHWRTAEAGHLPYSRADLAVFARAHGLPVDDRSAQGGGLWVLAAQPDANVGHVLARWGFTEVPGRGWRR